MIPPDIEAYLQQQIEGIGAVKVWAYTSTSLLHHWLEATSVQVDVRAASKERACDLAWQARAVLHALPGQTWHDGVVNAVEHVMGPAWVPDTDGAPRYVYRCTILYHPHPSEVPA